MFLGTSNKSVYFIFTTKNKAIHPNTWKFIQFFLIFSRYRIQKDTAILWAKDVVKHFKVAILFVTAGSIQKHFETKDNAKWPSFISFKTHNTAQYIVIILLKNEQIGLCVRIVGIKWHKILIFIIVCGISPIFTNETRIC